MGGLTSAHLDILFIGQGMSDVKIFIVTVLTLLFFVPPHSYSDQIGTVAPAFSLVDVNGRTVALEQLRGKVVFLDFWAPWCIPCKQELPELDKLQKKFGSYGLEVIGISIEPSEKNVAAFLQKVPLSVHIVIDKKNEVSDAYRVSSMPTGFIIGRDGTIRCRHVGFDRGLLPLYEKEITELLR
jgi:peroxiredoxin